MLAWPRLEIPRLDVHGPAVSVYDTENRSWVTLRPDDVARMYVCGITPYDSTHLGHAATYVGFDLLNRALRNAGRDVIYVQNVTDVDDPLLSVAMKKSPLVARWWSPLVASEKSPLFVSCRDRL